MPRVIFIDAQGIRKDIEVAVGMSLMRAATQHGVEGVVADCGGSMSCATCHVFVEHAFLDALDPPGATENQMLDFTAAPRQPNSRLSCQVTMREALDGMTVHVADPQL
jgi:2Fe-2S ferredoxin